MLQCIVLCNGMEFGFNIPCTVHPQLSEPSIIPTVQLTVLLE